jgi:uncharacterized protein YeaO (DUF488 family)
MDIRIERIYDPPTPEDGERILVDGIWPRGISEQQAHLDGRLRTLAAGNALRQWFDQDPARWDTLKARYSAGLDIKRDQVDVLVPRARTKRLTQVAGLWAAEAPWPLARRRSTSARDKGSASNQTTVQRR